MRCTAYWVHHGPTIYSHRPVIRYGLEPPPVEGPAPDLNSLTDSLFALLPELGQHRGPCDLEALPHLFEHMCIELQNLTGSELQCLRTRGAPLAGDDAVIPFDEESVGLEAGNLSLELVTSLSSGDLPFDFERRLEAFVRFAERQRLPAQDLAMVRAAEARDIPVIRIAGRLIQFGQGCHQQRLNGTESAHTSIVSNDLAANKDYARRVLRAVGLPVPAYERVHRIEDAVAAANRIGFPVVLKPNAGNMGTGVSVGLKTDREVREAFERTRGFRSVLVEEYVPGSDYRMLVINGKLEAAAQRVPAHVVGDGVHTIQELVRRANRDPRRGAGQRSSWTRIEFDDQSDRVLAERGYHRGSILPRGEIVYLKRIANTSAGGTAVDVTDQVHPENREIAERAAKAIGRDIAGVDLLVQDITLPMRAQGGVICEINSRPGVRKHLWPAEGRPRDVIGSIVDMLFPPGSRSRIPVAVMTGFGDTHGVARLLADLLGANGAIVGLAAHDGVFIDGERADGGGMNGPSAARMLFLDPAVELAVIEVPPSEALLHGLGFDWADACAVINDQPIEAPGLVDALRLVVGSARSHVVMSVEDEERYGLEPYPGARVWRVSADGGAPTEGHTGSHSGRSALYATALARCLGGNPDASEQGLASLSLDSRGPS